MVRITSQYQHKLKGHICKLSEDVLGLAISAIRT